MSLRDSLRLENREEVPDHSWLSKTRSRLTQEVHETVFGWVLKLVAEQALVKGKRIGVDASTMEANATVRTIVRRDDGRTYREMLTQMAKESGVETPTADDLVRIDRNRKGKKLSNEEWTSKTDPEAKVAKMKDGRTHLAYKPEHAVDLDTGVIVAAALHPADEGDTTTIAGTLMAAEKNLAQISAAPTTDQPSELVADKGYHSRAVLKSLDHGCGRRALPNPSSRVFHAGAATTRPARRSMPTAPAWVRGSASRRCGGGRKSSSDPSPTISIGAACGGPGCADAKISTNGTWSTSPATISAS